MELRPAAPDDAERVLTFWKNSGASTGSTDEPALVRKAIEHPTAVLLLAVSGNELVGTLLGSFDGWRGTFYRLVVHPAWRRQGIARQLVRRVEKQFTDWGVRRITVLIEVDRPWATEFWTAVGCPRDHQVVRHLGELENGS